MLDATILLRKHRAKGLFLDTNLFVLWLVGIVNRGRIEQFKRTQNFTVGDFELLLRVLQWFGPPLVSTPHVLSQVSNLTDLSGPELARVRRLFKSTVDIIDEQYDPAKALVQDAMFERFGLGDVSIAAVCHRNVLVLTADLQLQIALASLGLDALNFNHLRVSHWSSSG